MSNIKEVAIRKRPQWVRILRNYAKLNSSCPRNLRHFGNGQKKRAHIFEVLITFS